MDDKFENLIQLAKETNSEVLLLRKQNLKEFPSEILSLTNLRILDISENAIRRIPSEILNLINLVEINANANQIESIPSEIGKLKSLKRLLLRDNPIQQLPSSIKSLKLAQLDLQGSSLGIPPEILAKISNASSLIDYYFSNETLPLREAKVILVGQGSVGKTSLVNRLVNDTFNPQEGKTNGIGITKWQVGIKPEKSKPSETINLNIWDFGGQEIMHATHQFFLTKRSLYLLVCNTRTTESDNKLDYWLKIIHSFGGNSPVIVVGNKIDEHSFDINRRGLISKYPQIKAIIDTSCRDKQGIAELKEIIAREIADLPHIFDLVPKKWFDIKDKLSASGKNYLSYDEYKKICKKEGISIDTDQHNLIGFLHDLGTMIYFQDDPRLQELGILNPEWVTNGVYQIINSNSLFQTYGVLSLKDLETILPPNEYSRSHYAFIIDIMQKFELCYPFDNDANHYLIPDLLRKDETDTGDWNNALTFQYQYSVLPSSVLSRFIVRMHPFISKNTVWRNGVVLLIDDRRVKVKADYDLSKITIEIDGDGLKRDVLQQIRSQFRAIHETIPGLEVTEQVPISGHLDIFVNYKLLLNLESRKDFKHFVDKLNDYIDVRKLLDGVVSPSSQERQYPPRTRPKIWKSVLESPKHLGRFFLDIFGRSEAKESTAIIVGWLIIIVIILIWKGIISVQALESIWRFFFPVK
jgi:internalin A